MRKSLSLFVCLLLALGLFTGCDREETPETAAPTRAAKATETTAATQVTETTDATEAAEEPEEELNTVVFRSGDKSLQIGYAVIAVSQDGPFLAQGVQLNTQGADAFVQWLMSEEGRQRIGDFGVEEYGEAVFTVSADAPRYTGSIRNATGNIRLAVDEYIAASGLLETLIPQFEETRGCTVEIAEGTAPVVISAARNGNADLILVRPGEATQALIDDGFVRTVAGLETEQPELCAVQYLLCGPKDDPAGVGNCTSVTDAFAAIAAGECIFTSRGDNSIPHQLEQKFWGEDVTFGNWHISAEMEMGPCLVLNDIEQGYILTDKLTWLQFFSANGII